MYLPRFLGRAGVISKKLGSCYQVKIDDMGKEKLLIVHPVHLRKAAQKEQV
jgi:ribosomal protein L21E